MSRRAVLAGALATVVSACTSGTRRAVAARALRSPATGAPTIPATSSTTSVPVTTTTVPSPSTTSTSTSTTVPPPPTTLPVPAGLPVHAIPARVRPVYRVADYLPRAPRSAVALTIDDGPDPRWTPAVLALLAQNRVKATFSIVGIHAVRYPGLVQRMAAAGHGICNHTMTHPQPFVARTWAQIDNEVVQGTMAIYRTTGRLPGVFRAPGGEWNEFVFQSCARMGQTPIDWDVDPQDWRLPGAQIIAQRLLAARPGDILLCHDGGGDRSETVKALQTVLPALKGRGLTFVTL